MLSRPQRQQTAKTTSVAAPVKGLNAKDSIANMDPDYALVLDNIFCTPTTVDTRNGSNTWVTGITGWIETITHYTSATAQKLFAAATTKVYDVTTTGAVGAAVVSSQTNARYQTTNFATAGGQYLYMVNGADAPLLYDGTNWTKITGISVPAITGVTTTLLIHVNAFKNRLWFTEVNSLRVWYLPVNSIAGAANSFDLSSIFQRGGYLMGMVTWTIDNTSGVDDYAVFVSSEGEVAIYKGYDPAFASTFTLVGLFRMGRPIGRRFFVKMGSDNVIICADGIALLSKELTTDRNISSTLSFNIVNLIGLDVQSFAGNFGWQATYYPIGNKLIINVPSVENSVQYQYVMNTITGAWSTWNKQNTGFSAACWDVFQDNIFFGGNGIVYQGDVSESDSGIAIQSNIKPAFSYFGQLGQSKLFTMVRPIIISDGNIMPSFALCLDFADTQPPTPQLSSGSGSPWDTSPWDTTSWGGSPQVNKNWLTVGGIGYAASLRMGLITKNVSASLQSIDYVYEGGGVL